MADYDAIVIGAGNGGLAAAATLAGAGASVCVLERHNIPGGCATSFCRGRFEFEVALHQLSGMGTEGNPGPLRFTMANLGVLERVEFIESNDLYRIQIPDRIDITLKTDRKQVVDELSGRFPEEREAIANFFDMLYAYFQELVKAFFLKDPDASPERYPLIYRYSMRSTKDVMDSYFRSPLLKSVITIYWSYLGLPPSRLMFMDFAITLYSYLEYKSYHVKGGSQSISNALADIIVEKGQEIRFNCGVKRILVRDGRAAGVITETGEEISAGCVISNASKITTYVDLIDREHLPGDFFGHLRSSAIGVSALSLYMGLDCPPSEAGITQPTNFISPTEDYERAYECAKTVEVSEDSGLLTCYNYMDPSFSPEGTTIATFVTLKYGEPWMQIKPEEYHEIKFRCGEQMMEILDRVYPGVRGRIEEFEIATPLTHLRYLGHPNGSVYGFDQHPWESSFFTQQKAPIPGLFITGAWAGMGGFQPTYQSGEKVARLALKNIKG
ncbi:MAG: NAD(P)/FAD-dependent oxidoreductase [Spirochaetes bacterium]|nr:NAD(P)/FAD-dependent oxidoreductase [Spirochaetota bacterium]